MKWIIAAWIFILSLLAPVTHAPPTVKPVTVLVSYYPQAGFPITPRPPRPGIYYTSVAVNNPLPYTFTVQNGTNQNSLAAGSAQLFAVPSSGAPITLNAPATSFPYGAYLGPIQVVWFEPDDTPGSYPSPLNPPSGLVLWTPPLFIGDDANDFVVRLVPSSPLKSVTITNLSILAFDLPTFIVYGFPSGDAVSASTASPPPGQSVTIPVTPVAGDTSYFIEATGTGGGQPILYGSVSLGL